jgi:hypothetical protein
MTPYESMLDTHIYVASFNTRDATELCIRTMRRLAGHPFQLTVGDCGSTDGSLTMLEAFERRGWLRLEVHAGRQHAEWIDAWLARDDVRFAVVSDSDIQFLQRGWLRHLIRQAKQTRAAVVYSEYLAGSPTFAHPRTGEVMRLASRPAPWLFLADRQLVREVGVSFAEHADRTDAQDPVVYDVGGRFFNAVREQELELVSMPRRFRLAYRHYGGQSWIPEDSDMAPKKERDLRLIQERLRYQRMRDEQRAARAWTLAAQVEARAGMSAAYRIAKKLRDPAKVARRLNHALSRREVRPPQRP